jgi:peptidyl-prolyl cis-trans isomerase SurA
MTLRTWSPRGGVPGRINGGDQMSRTTLALLLLLGLMAFGGRAVAAQGDDQLQLIDGIAAVVGDQIILESEVDEEFYIYRMRTGSAMTPEEGEKLRAGILKDMVDEMLLVAQAHRDSISVSDEEVDAEIAKRVDDLRARYGTDEALNKALEENGTTLDELRETYRDDVERRLLAEKVVRQEVYSKIDVTWGEVSAYYDAHRDEVGLVPESYQLAGILVTPKPSEAAKEAAIARLTEARQKLESGTPFEQVAAEYSDDASASRGGDLGTFGRGTMVPEFEDAVFALAPGEISGIVPTRFGFHIVQVIDETDGQVHARHILARVAPGPSDVERAQAKAESLQQLAVEGADFSQLAAENSDDERSKANGGVLGWFRKGEMAPDIEKALAGLEAGDVAPVVPANGGFYVIKVLEHESQRVAGLDEVRVDLRDYLYGQEAEKGYNDLIDRLSKEIYVDIRTPAPAEE